MSLTLDEINALGEVLDTSWGRSSTGNSSTVSFKAKFRGAEHIEVTYVSVVTFSNVIAQYVAERDFEADATKLTKEYLRKIEKEFKELAGKEIKLKIEGSDISMEMLNTSPHNPKKTAYFRQKSLVKIS